MVPLEGRVSVATYVNSVPMFFYETVAQYMRSVLEVMLIFFLALMVRGQTRRRLKGRGGWGPGYGYGCGGGYGYGYG